MTTLQAVADMTVTYTGSDGQRHSAYVLAVHGDGSATIRRGYYDPLLAQLESAIGERFMDKRHESMWTVVDGPEDVLGAIESAASWDADSRDFAVVR